MPLHTIPFRPHDHFFDHELGFVFRIVRPHRKFILLQPEVDRFSQRDEFLGRLSDNDIDDFARYQRVLRTEILRLWAEGPPNATMNP